MSGLESSRRLLTLIPASAIVISSMVGTGIFTTTGLMVAMGAGGGDILLAWFFGGIVALCGALCYGEIGANLPRSGGEYYYLSRLLHAIRHQASLRRLSGDAAGFYGVRPMDHRVGHSLSTGSDSCGASHAADRIRRARSEDYEEKASQR